MMKALALALCAAAALAQTPQQPPPRFRTEANFVRVDVYVTQAGRPLADLRAEEFEVFEDGAPQSIASFEAVSIRAPGATPVTSEPTSERESLQRAARSRVSVIFLDLPRISVEGAHGIREPLIRFIDRAFGPDDLIGVMTPTMAPSQVVLARKHEVLAQEFREHPFFGYPGPSGTDGFLRDEREAAYHMCYSEQQYGMLAQQMIDRRRERMTLNAFEDLVRYLRYVREERKGIVVISEGWVLYTPDDTMTKLRKFEQVPGVQQTYVGPGGKITTNNPANVMPSSKYECDKDRIALSMIDNVQYLRDVVGEANRSNASFYTMDPRGLVAAFPAEYQALRRRHDALQNLASGTDGFAVLNSNDLDNGLRRIGDDLSFYYLLGYQSTNAKLDGRHRTIRVRVKRPGVNVRAREGYRAATETEIAAATPPPGAAAPPETASVAEAMAELARGRPDARLRIRAAAIGVTLESFTHIWVEGEVRMQGAADPWLKGATADVEVTIAGATGVARIQMAPGDRTFFVPVKLDKPMPSAAVNVRVRLTGDDPAAGRLLDDLYLDEAGQQTLLFRRGPSTGNRVLPAANAVFSRAERVRVDVPSAGATTARVLDRGGTALPIPVTVGERVDEQTGLRWATAELSLAPLAPADYAIEVTQGSRTLLTAIRVVR
jgi:VWFA-related protein